ncbi:MAG: molybdopterin-binding protein [Bacteroidales bacterium]|nr:molybdopterin-binding protein [Bacteroidales bacterium]
MNRIKILSLNISQQKGTTKIPVNEVTIDEKGILNDAHYGTTNREISLLDITSIQKFEKILNRKINYGEFAENITTNGLDYTKVKPLDILYNENITLQITQIGKECNNNKCSIFKQTGKCVMPEEGIFLRVIKEGKIKINDELYYQPKVFNVAIITLSTRAFNKEYEDISGKILIEKLKSYFNNINYLFNIEYYLIPDNEILLEAKLNRLIINKTDIIITTGGTGISNTDITTNIASKVITKEIPGIMDYIRLKYSKENIKALTSRSIVGVKNSSLIFCLPGSKNAVTEYVEEISKHLLHLIYMINNIDIHK